MYEDSEALCDKSTRELVITTFGIARTKMSIIIGHDNPEGLRVSAAVEARGKDLYSPDEERTKN